ncbi:single-stranded DNA-binding protein [Rhodococcus sp. X156]|uniref:single-stranded DNA-binding protein n=1 Tax=Rhodococcus sp. X156 TaxID=2499145 RepID=UPI000FD8484A|nr:single-stranded DNA-binding protein [Rhodococcus sp. X156]
MTQTTVTLVGTVVTDPYRRHTAEGAPFIKFRMACNERRLDRATQEWVDGDSLYVNVTCWRRLVKGVGAAVGKGDPVIVVGRLYTREWMEEGGRRSSLELDASTVGPDLARCVAVIDNTRRLGSDAGAPDGAPVTDPRAGGAAGGDDRAESENGYRARVDLDGAALGEDTQELATV